MKTNHQLLRTLTAFVLVLCLVAAADACPNCKDAIAGDPNQEGLAKGLYYSILFMISMPFLIFGGICSYFYWLVRCERSRQATSVSPQVQFGSVVPSRSQPAPSIATMHHTGA